MAAMEVDGAGGGTEAHLMTDTVVGKNGGDKNGDCAAPAQPQIFDSIAPVTLDESRRIRDPRSGKNYNNNDDGSCPQSAGVDVNAFAAVGVDAVDDEEDPLLPRATSSSGDAPGADNLILATPTAAAAAMEQEKALAGHPPLPPSNNLGASATAPPALREATDNDALSRRSLAPRQPPPELADLLRNLPWFWRSDEPAAQAHASQRLQHFSSSSPEGAAAIASATGALRFLVHVMQQDYSPGRELAKEAAASALANVAYFGGFSGRGGGCGGARRAVAAAGAVPAAVALLCCHDARVAGAAAGCLANLAAEPALLADAVARGAPAAAVALLRAAVLAIPSVPNEEGREGKDDEKKESTPSLDPSFGAAAAEEALAFLYLDVTSPRTSRGSSGIGGEDSLLLAAPSVPSGDTGKCRAAAAASLGLVHLSARLLEHPRLSARGRWLIGLIWSKLIPVEDRVVQHELAKATPLLVHLASKSSTAAAASPSSPRSLLARSASRTSSPPSSSTSAPLEKLRQDSCADAAALLLAEYASSDEANAAHAKRAGAAAVLRALLTRASAAAAAAAPSNAADKAPDALPRSGTSSPSGNGSGSGSDGEGGSNGGGGGGSSSSPPVPRSEDPCYPAWAAAAAGLRAMGVEPVG